MRAKDFPPLLFRTIHQALDSPEIKTITGYHTWNYFELKSDDRTFANIGLLENLRTDYGKSSRFGLWGYTICDPMTDNDEIRLLDPTLEIWGGPVNSGVWVLGRGNSITEKVKIKSYGCGLDSPLIRLMGQILVLADDLFREKKPASLSYWQSFINPKRRYDRPD